MASKNKNNFYVGKQEDNTTWLYYGEKPPIFKNGEITGCDNNFNILSHLIGSFSDNPIADSLAVGDVIKIYIRKENKKK